MKGMLLVLVFAILCITLSESLRIRRPRANTCHLPKKVGFCRARIPRYYYNAKTRQCELFYYGGCRGNGNRFRSMRQCQRKCGSVKFNDPCKQPVKTGPCRANFRRFFYNARTGKCQRFVYGGCLGNGNNFRTMSHCYRSCVRRWRYKWH